MTEVTLPTCSSSRYQIHILFQFIIVEYLRTSKKVEKLKALTLSSIQIQDSQSTSTINFKNDLLHIIEDLVGSSSPFRSNFSWNFSHGILTALKHESALFQVNFSSTISEAFLIKKHVTKCWHYCVELRDIVSHFPGSLTEHSPEFSLFQKVKGQLIRELKAVGKVIAKAILHFDNEENILLCLLLRKEQLDESYGTAFTLDLFIKMHKKLDSSEDLLVDAYRKRGFEELIPLISQKISSLQSSK